LSCVKSEKIEVYCIDFSRSSPERVTIGVGLGVLTLGETQQNLMQICSVGVPARA